MVFITGIWLMAPLVIGFMWWMLFDVREAPLPDATDYYFVSMLTVFYIAMSSIWTWGAIAITSAENHP